MFRIRSEESMISKQPLDNDIDKLAIIKVLFDGQGKQHEDAGGVVDSSVKH